MPNENGAGLKGALPATLGAFRLEEALRGFNVSTQYVSVLSYEVAPNKRWKDEYERHLL